MDRSTFYIFDHMTSTKFPENVAIKSTNMRSAMKGSGK